MSDQDKENGVQNNSDDKCKAEEVSEEQLIEYVRAQCMKNRVGGSIMGLSTMFRNLDKDHSKKLNLTEFCEGMSRFGIKLSDCDLRRLFKRFDTNQSHTVDFNEFLKVLKPPMPQCRKRLVFYVFDLLDKDHNGVLTTEDIAQSEYFRKSAMLHPKLKSGEWRTLEDVYAHFINTFDDKTEPDGKVTKEEFLEYYSMVSCAVDKDDAFDLMMCRAFDLDRNKVKRENLF